MLHPFLHDVVELEVERPEQRDRGRELIVRPAVEREKRAPAQRDEDTENGTAY